MPRKFIKLLKLKTLKKVSTDMVYRKLLCKNLASTFAMISAFNGWWTEDRVLRYSISCLAQASWAKNTGRTTGDDRPRQSWNLSPPGRYYISRLALLHAALPSRKWSHTQELDLYLILSVILWPFLPTWLYWYWSIISMMLQTGEKQSLGTMFFMDTQLGSS